MASLLIRNVDEQLHTQLKARAQAHHRSLEEEVRETLRSAIAQEAGTPVQENLMQMAARFFGPDNGVDLPPRSSVPQRPAPDFSGPEYDR